MDSETSPHALPQLVDAAERLVVDYADLPSGAISATVIDVQAELGTDATADDIERVARDRLSATA